MKTMIESNDNKGLEAEPSCEIELVPSASTVKVPETDSPATVGLGEIPTETDSPAAVEGEIPDGTGK